MSRVNPKLQQFAKWFYARFILLEGILLPNSPYFILLKTGLTVFLVLLICRYAQIPDQVSATFVSTLCISPVVLLGINLSKSIAISTIIGTGWGMLGRYLVSLTEDDDDDFSVSTEITTSFTETTIVSIEDTVEPDFIEGPWLILATVPMAICLAQYTLFVLQDTSPGSISNATFSALFVQLVPFHWVPLYDWGAESLFEDDNFGTFIVRVLAVSVAILTALVVNSVVSGSSYRVIFQKRLLYIENMIKKTGDNHPMTQVEQLKFTHLFSLVEDIEVAKNEPTFRSSTKKTLDALAARASSLFRFQSTKAVLYYIENDENSSTEDREAARLLRTWATESLQEGFQGGRATEVDPSLVPASLNPLHRILNASATELQADFKRSSSSSLSSV